jgi:dienelactone hydrolase
MTTEQPEARAVNRIRLSVAPLSSRIDEPVSIIVEGLPASAAITIRARTQDGSRQEWESSATFRADEHGVVDVSRASATGSYEGIDGSGLLWSMAPVGAKRPTFFNRRKPGPLAVTATVLVADEVVAEQEFVRTFTDPGVTQTPTPTDSELVGTLFRPDSDRVLPGVLLVGGSDGGQQDHAAALLAAHGYAVLSLAYFGAEDRPSHLNHIELGYFDHALRWLARQPGVDARGIAAIGLSRGGELVLQLGSMFPMIAAVVAGSPSSVRQAGLTSSYTDFTQPAWLSDGEKLPFIPAKYGPRQFFGFLANWILRRPMRQRAMFQRLLADREVAAKAAIEVERIAGPVLLISGQDDQLWPSDVFAQRVIQRLREHQHPYPNRQLSYPGAGHFVCFPYGLPTLPPFTRLSPVAGLTIDFGGTAPANAAAAQQSWRAILDFLARFAATLPDRAR